MTIIEIFEREVQEFIDDAKVRAADGLSLSDVSRLFVSLINRSVRILLLLSDPGHVKKRMVLMAVGRLYDVIGPAIPLPLILQPFRRLIRPHLRRIVMILCEGAIDAIYCSLRSVI